MRAIKNVLTKGCIYTVAIMTVFYLFVLISDFQEKSMGIDKYFIILGFGFLISISNLVFDFKIPAVVKYLINYTVLVTGFCIIFISSTSGSDNKFIRFFVAIVIFSLVYGLCLALRSLLKGLRAKNKSSEQRASVSNKNKKG